LSVVFLQQIMQYLTKMVDYCLTITAKINLRAKRAAAKELVALDRAAKKSARIAKLEAKLISLKTGNVGSVAIKMNKKPSACTTVYQMAA